MSPSLKRKSAVEFTAADAKKPKQNASITSFFGQPKPAATATATAAVSKPEQASDSTAPGTVEANGTSSTATTTVTTVPSTSAGAAPAAFFTTSPTTAAKPARKPFDKEAWIAKLSEEQKELLKLEIDTLDESWLAHLADEITSKDFLNLKRFLKTEFECKQKIYPPMADVYSWSRHTPLHTVKAVILGQDPYHNVNQAHGLCFSVRPPTPAPPSLKNIYIALKKEYSTFSPPPANGGLLTPWADRGVLLLNTVLTVRAHEANSHAGKGWEKFTQKVIDTVVKERKSGVVFLAWGTPAQKRCQGISGKHLVLKTVHPSPLSAARGFFDCGHFKKTNDFLREKYGEDAVIDWNLNVPPEKAGV